MNKKNNFSLVLLPIISIIISIVSYLVINNFTNLANTTFDHSYYSTIQITNLITFITIGLCMGAYIYFSNFNKTKVIPTIWLLIMLFASLHNFFIYDNGQVFHYLQMMQWMYASWIGILLFSYIKYTPK